MNGLLKHRNIALMICTMAITLVCHRVPAQIITARAVLDTNKVFIGDRLTLHLVIEKPVDVVVTFPDTNENLTDEIVIVSKSPIDTSLVSDGIEKLEKKLIIAAFDTGFIQLPSLPFVFHAANFSDTVETLPSIFEVISLQLDEDIRDIKANYNAPVTLFEIVPYFLGLLLIALSIWLVRKYYLKKYGKIPVALANAELDPPDVNAINELEKLKRDAPWKQNRVKYYYIKLSEIIRNYIEQQFHVAALERTTGEILHAMEGFNGDGSILQLLSRLLSLSDLVKFAKVIPGEDENEGQIDMAIEYIKKTSALIADRDRDKSEPETEAIINTEK